VVKPEAVSNAAARRILAGYEHASGPAAHRDR
jgi:hypothetical protein